MGLCYRDKCREFSSCDSNPLHTPPTKSSAHNLSRPSVMKSKLHFWVNRAADLFSKSEILECL